MELVEVKERILPELDDAFAKAYEAENMEKLREGVRSDLQNELNLKQKRDIRNQIVNALLSRVNFELPETPVQEETRKLVYEIVDDYRKRGLSKEVIDQQKDRIYSLASQGAKGRVKALFLFRKIAEKEGIRVFEGEVQTRILALANAYQMPPKKFMKELEERSGVGAIVQDLLQDKVIDFLQENARFEDVEPATAVT